MAIKKAITTDKLQKKPVSRLTGKDGNTFTKDNQPSPELKKEGWKKLRSERLLTQAILAHMLKGKNMETFIKSLYTNANKGNPKAIESICKGIEDDIQKIDQRLVDSEGNDRSYTVTLNIK